MNLGPTRNSLLKEKGKPALAQYHNHLWEVILIRTKRKAMPAKAIVKYKRIMKHTCVLICYDVPHMVLDKSMIQCSVMHCKSGAQVNPTVTIGLLVSGKLTPKEAGLYIVSQFVAAIIASAVVFAMFGQSMAAGVTLPSDGNVIGALMLETVMTFTLVYVVLSTTTAKDKIAPLAGLAIGFTLGLNVIFGGSVTGGSLNPARSFGPALIMGNFSYNWIYWVAPIMGGLIAAGIYKGLHKDADRPLAEDETLRSRRSSQVN